MARPKKSSETENNVEVESAEGTEASEGAGAGKKAVTPMTRRPELGDIFYYARLRLFLLTPMLATNPSVSIAEKHIIEKSRKLMERANKQKGKMTKELEMYAGGQEIPESKKIEDLRGIIRAYMEITGKVYEIPKDVPGIIELASKVEGEIEDMLEKGEMAPTVFLRNEEGFPCISAHMILGNIKEVLRNTVSGGDNTVTVAKNSVGTICAQDIKWVTDSRFLVARDYKTGRPVRIIEEPVMVNGVPKLDENGIVVMKPKYLIRPLRSEQMGQVKVCIAVSEQLPEQSYFEGVFRIRKKGAFGNLHQLEYILNHGVSLGLGQWRGSGGYGSFDYDLDILSDYREEIVDWKSAVRAHQV